MCTGVFAGVAGVCMCVASVCMYVHVHSCVCSVCMCAQVCVQVCSPVCMCGAQKRASGTFLCHGLLVPLKQVLYLNLAPFF